MKDERLTNPSMVEWRVLAAILCACLMLQLARPLAALPLHFSWNYGEGWNAYWATRAMGGAPIYTDRLSAITNNYPPLSFYLVSIAALAACAAMVGLMITQLGAGRKWGAAGAGGFLLYVATFAWRYVGSDDPQWLAAAFSLAALIVLTRMERAPSSARIVVACALLIVGGLIKHNQLAAPIAITLWLARGDRRGLVVWLASAALFVTATFLLLHAVFGPAMFDQVFHHRRVFKARYIVNMIGTLSGLLPEIALAMMLARCGQGRRPCRRIALVLLFAWIALALGIVERFGTGVSVNAHFDSAIGFMIAAGIALGRAGMMERRTRWRATLVLLLPLVLATLILLPRTIGQFANLGDARARWQTAIAMARAAPGPVACELPALCYWADRPFSVDFFNYGQKLRTEGDPARLGAALAHRTFALMVVVRDAHFDAGDGRLPDGYNHLIAANYRTVMVLPDHALLLARRAR